MGIFLLSSTRPDADEPDLRQLFHGRADAFPADPALLDAAERIHVEAETARLVHPERSDLEILGKAEGGGETRSEEHTSELQSLMRNSYAVFCLITKNTNR